MQLTHSEFSTRGPGEAVFIPVSHDVVKLCVVTCLEFICGAGSYMYMKFI